MATNDLYYFLNDITFQTGTNFGINDSTKLRRFYEDLELNVIEEIFSGKDKIDVVCSNYKHGKNEISGFISNALRTSGIDEYGMIPYGSRYDIDSLEVTDKTFEQALEEYNEIEKECLGNDFDKRFCYNARYNIEHDVIDIPETLRAAFYIKDRMNGLIDYEYGDFLNGVLLAYWSKEAYSLEAAGFKKSLCYKICDDVVNSNKHYDINTRNSLIAMAYLDYKIICGRSISSDEIDKTLLYNETAKTTNNDMISSYEKELKERLNNKAKVLYLNNRRV